jgi:dUTP pyrophosphatase
MSSKLIVKKLSKFAVIPKRGTDGAAGYDLSSAEDTVVPKRGKALVKTGLIFFIHTLDLAMIVPHGHYGRIAPRSGLAWKNSIDVGAGVIDEDYRGPVGVILFNFGDEDFVIKQGDRIAQLILEKISTPDVEEVDELPETIRGEGGFGSTGVKNKI